MRYNKQELFALASQNSQNFDREGVLMLKEKQDGFFRRSEGWSPRWFRLRGNLLFYLKGPEPWHEPAGALVLTQHRVDTLAQDDHGHWPFQITWSGGAGWALSARREVEREGWLRALRPAPYEAARARLADLKERLQALPSPLDVREHRLRNHILTDMNEVPLCEVALSCDNLSCDALGRPPSPRAVIYVRLRARGPRLRYQVTETIHACSNPSFSKTVVFLASDGLSGASSVQVVVYDVREQVSGVSVRVGCAVLRLTTIQEAQRLRVALLTPDNRPAGFVTINGWSLEPAYSGGSPAHCDHRPCVEAPQKALACHRRAHSLPPKLGLKLKFPSYGSLLKQNFVNSYQVTYRFHSGLGGDITVHEIMAEPKMCFQLPIQLLDMYIEGERSQLEEVCLAGGAGGELAATHATLLRQYELARRRMLDPDPPCFKQSCRKGEAGLQFAPTNLHLQRMWAHNDALAKAGAHDVLTAGAFAAHAHQPDRSGGLLRLVQQAQESGRAAPCVSGAHDAAAAARALRLHALRRAQRLPTLLHAGQTTAAMMLLQDVRSKVESLLALWEPRAVEQVLSAVGWPAVCTGPGNTQRLSPSGQLGEHLSTFDTSSECDTLESSSSSKETSPTDEVPGLSASAPDVSRVHHDFFSRGRDARCQRSLRALRPGQGGSEVEQVTCRCDTAAAAGGESVEGRAQLQGVGVEVQRALSALANAVHAAAESDGPELSSMVDLVHQSTEQLSRGTEAALRWLSAAHAALRLRCEPPQRARQLAALRARRDACFSQALSTAVSGLTCWLGAAPRGRLRSVLRAGLGPLCAFEGLLSLHGAERAMWGDMVVAVEDLHAVEFRLEPAACSEGVPRLSGSRGALAVLLPVSDALLAELSADQLSFTVTAVLFNIGINEKASLAEALGETGPQQQSNCDNFERLSKYYQQYCRLFPDAPTARASSRAKPLEEVMENLRTAVHRKVPKNVEVLHLAALAARLMNGVRFTSCKSAKDRTGMSVTLEQCAILSAEYHLAEHETRKALDVMRSEGCRRENTLKNTGVRKYAFTKKQVMALPVDYRPPPGTYGSAQT